jgi:hypothetical protein
LASRSSRAPIPTGYVVSVTGRFDVAFDLAGALVPIGITPAMVATRRPIG